MKENVGVLMPVGSLPGNHGIGDFGKNSYDFIKWLKKHHYNYWQILPLNPVGPGSSPYMSMCSEAIDIRYISLDMLVKDGLLKKVPNFQAKSISIKYDEVYEFKRKWLFKTYKNFLKGPQNGFKRFKTANKWATYYGTYLVLKKKNDNKIWNEWDKKDLTYFDKHKTAPKRYLDEINFEIFMQYIAVKQWNKLWAFARKKGIKIIADCPFYVGIDSVDCWLHKDQFLMDEKYNPTLVSGCPPDAFSDEGQLWGTPIFDFKKMKEDNYSFLVDRIGHLTETCDILRLDHFRAWDTYCVIPAEDENAKRGVWWEGPRYEFFDALYAKYPNAKLIAEDLGDLFQGVHDLRDHYHLPGMFIMEFCIFDYEASSNERTIVYPGTHDNETFWGWYKNLSKENIAFLNRRFNYPKNLYNTIFEYTWNVPSYLTIFALQDLLKLDNKARINYPGTYGEPNWCWKLKDMSWMKKVKYGQ